MQGCQRVIYLAGSGRSGSTLLERTLGAVPGVANIGELIELFRKPSVATELCGCGRPFAECEFWSAVGDRVFGSWSSPDVARVGRLQRRLSRQRYLPRLLAAPGVADADRETGSRDRFAAELAEYTQVYRRLYDAVADISGCPVVVDASKWPGQALALHRGGLPVSLAHVVRDPRGVAYSWAKVNVVRPHGGAGTSSVMATHSATATARRWAAFQSEIDLIRPLFGASTRVRYEDFVTAPATTVRRLLAEMGLDTDGATDHIDGDIVSLPASHGVAGNPSRFTNGAVRVRADDEWRARLPAADRRRVTALTAPWLVRFGYPLRAHRSDRAVTSPQRRGAMPAAEPALPPPAECPAVDVVLPTRGRPDLVREAVASVVAQDYPGPLHVMVVHDQEAPQHELKRLATPTRSVTLLANLHRPGLAGARNSGLDVATADYVASCDDDDTWDPDKLSRQMARMLADPGLGVLGAGIRLLMSEDRVVEWPGDSSVVSRAQLLRSRRKELHSSTLLVRRRVYAEVGGYDETLPESYAEDYEFLLRAVETGRIGVVTTPLASIRKYNTSWFSNRAEVVAGALRYLLDTHPQIAESRRGHARVLGQIAFAEATLGHRAEAWRLTRRAFASSWQAPHAALALIHLTTGVDPRRIQQAVRRLGRGIT